MIGGLRARRGGLTPAATVPWLVSLVLLAGLPAAAGQQLPTAPPRDVAPTTAAATGVIKGVVTAADTGTPLRGAEIRVTGGSQPALRPRGTVADGEGRYEITGLPPGQYTVTASKTGFVAVAYGQMRAVDAGRTVQVQQSGAAENIDIALPRGAVITVRIADELGDPLPAYRVTLLQPRFVDGRRTLTATGNDTASVTDDRGEMRLSGLAPGEYYVAAITSGSIIAVSPRAKEPQTFYPGTASETDAQPVTVGLAEEILVAFSVAHARAARIAGVVEGFTGRPPQLRMERRTLGTTTIVDVNLAPDGTFSASNLVPADYLLTARGDTGFAMLRFRLAGEDLDGLVLAMHPQVPLRGRFTFDPKPPANLPPSTVQESALRPTLTEGSSMILPVAVAQVKNDWTFEIPGAMGTGVLRFARPPRDWFLQAILLDGVDITDTPVDFATVGDRPLEVRLTQRATRVSGTVNDGARRAGTYVVVLFPEDRQQWTPYARTIASARPDQQGRFLIEGVPPGRYLLAAVEHLEPGEERYAGTLERLRGAATPIALAEAGTTTVELTLSR